MRAVLERKMKMREVKVNRLDLLEKIRTNREKHILEYKEAVANYKRLAINEIARRTKSAKMEITETAGLVIAKVERMTKDDIQQGPGDVITLLKTIQFNLRVPISHEKDYNQVISMLEMSVDEQLSVRSDEFACYVMDDWEWKQDFMQMSSSYKAMV